MRLMPPTPNDYHSLRFSPDGKELFYKTHHPGIPNGVIERVPLSEAARAALAKEPALIETILTGGDDYEVLACVPADKLAPLRRQVAAAVHTSTSGHRRACRSAVVLGCAQA